MNLQIVHEADATRYEIHVAQIDNPSSNYDTQYLVSLINFGECFFESDLSFIAEVILRKSSIFSSVDAVNIQDAIADHIEGVRRVKFDYPSRSLVRL
jgi:hypothetical protein